MAKGWQLGAGAALVLAAAAGYIYSRSDDSTGLQRQARSSAHSPAGTDGLAPGPRALGSDQAKEPPAPSAAPPAAPGHADVGFRAKANGFSFENYDNSDDVVNLTVAELRRMFGDEVCASIAAGRCHLTPAAKEWMEELNDSMDGGHCEGMAVLSLLFYANKAATADFGAPTVAGLQLEGNPKLQREIAYWYSLQEASPTADSETTGLTPSQVLDRLTSAFQAGKSAELYELGIYHPEFENGHALTPYSVVDRGNQRFAIGVYDSGFPGEERFVEVDRAKDTWRYVAGDDPSDPEGLYTGDARTATLELSPLLVRLDKHTCPFCGDLDPAAKTSAGHTRRMQVMANDQAHLLVSDQAGNQTGRQGAALVNAIPQAIIARLRGRDLRDDGRDPVYSLPLGNRYQIAVAGVASAKPQPAAISVVGPGFAFSVDGAPLPPGQHDSLVVSKELTEFSYQAAAAGSPEVQLGISTPQADYEFTITATAGDGGVKVTLRLDQAKGMLSLQLASAKGGKVDCAVQMERMDDEGSELFSHKGLSVDAADILWLDYAHWTGDGQPATLQLDVGGRGAKVQTLSLSDDE